MIDEYFCELLEGNIEIGLANAQDELAKGFWCDGVLLPVFEHEYDAKYVNDNRNIRLTAFVGVDGQDKYELILLLGPKSLSKYSRGINISDCLPNSDSDDWFNIDAVGKRIYIKMY